MDPANYRKSLDERLKNEAMRLNLPVNTVRQHEAIKRFVSRLLRVSESLVLKGAVVLEARLILAEKKLAFRTGDLDIATTEESRALLANVERACEIDSDDHFLFRILGREEVETDGYSTLEVTVEARLAGKEWQQFPVDIVGNEPLIRNQSVELLSLGTNLDNISINDVPVQSIASALAEKLKAYSKQYGGRRSSRERDLPDMIALADLAIDGDLRAGTLREAVKTIFGDLPVPNEFPEPPPDWPDHIEPRLAGLTADLESQYGRAKGFWDPILFSDTPTPVADDHLWTAQGWSSFSVEDQNE